MTQKAHDELDLESVGASRFVGRPVKPIENGLECYPPGRVSLRVEEYLRVSKPLGPDLSQIGSRQIMEIGLVLQDRHALVVKVEKILKPGETIGLAQRLDRIIRQSHPVAGGEGEHELRLEGSFDVEMQLRFRQPFDQTIASVHLHSLEPDRLKPDLLETIRFQFFTRRATFTGQLDRS